MKIFRFAFLILIMLLGVSRALYGQADYVGTLSAVTLSSNLEETSSSYTMAATPVVDTDPPMPATGYSYVAAGSPGAVFFPTGTNMAGVTSVTLTIGGLSYVVPATPYAGYATFVTPVAVPRGQAVSLLVPDVVNPPFNPACLSNPNNYDEGSGPCNDGVYFALNNATGGGNYFHHFGTVRYNIARRSYFVKAITLERTNLALAPQGTVDNEMLTANIIVGGSFGAFPVLNGLTFNTAATTNAADITAATVWFTHQLKYFHAPGEVLLGMVSNPVGHFATPALTRPLAKGNNFVWMAYDLRCDQTAIGRALDGDLVSMVIDGTLHSPPGPASMRAIGPYYTMPTANLIPNPGFETFSSCPSVLTQSFDNSIAKATGWNYLSPTVGGTADYFNACAAGGQADVPTNAVGVQAAHGGNGYAGLVLDGFFANFYEYLTAPLSATLQADTTYYLSFYVASADYFANGNPVFKSNGLGALFTSAPVVVTNATKLTATAQFQYAPIVYDQQDWVHVFGTFTALGNENRITVGAFGAMGRDTLATSAFRTPASIPGSYLYLDDFTLCKLSQVSKPCLNGPLAMQAVRLSVESVSGQNRLLWQPTMAAPTDRFEIWAGSQVDQLQMLGVVAGDAGRPVFEYWDGHARHGAIFYQVRQVHGDGAMTVSNLVEALSLDPDIRFTNPVGDRLQIHGLGLDCTYRICAADGRVCLQGSTAEFIILVDALPSGLYFLELFPVEGPRIVNRLLKE